MKNRNKKVTAGLLAATLLLGASSLAWFTDRKENSIAGQAGNLCIEMTDISGDLNDLAPGDNRELTFAYDNSGSLSMDTRVTYVLSYELDKDTASTSENDLDVIATLYIDREELVLKSDESSVKGTFESGTVKGISDDMGEDKLEHTLNFKFDESVGNIGQKMKFKLDVLVEGKQNRNNPTWEQVHKTTIEFGGQELNVVPVSACNISKEDYTPYFKFDEIDEGYEVAGFVDNVEEVIAENGMDPDFRYNPIIPSEYKGKPVTKVGEGAFFWNQLTSVEIPDSVTKIGEDAFYWSQLKSVDIPDSVTVIDAGAFASNKLTSINIPDSVTEIGKDAFYSNQLTSVILGDSLTKIGPEAFANNKLTSVTIPDSVTAISEGAFEINQLTSVKIPNSVTSIGRWAFERNQLTSVEIPNSVVEIGEHAFEGNQLTSVVIPNSVTEIGEYAFAFNQLTSVVIPDSVAEIGFWAFDLNSGGVIYANEVEGDSWPVLRGYEFGSEWSHKSLSEYKK